MMYFVLVLIPYSLIFGIVFLFRRIYTGRRLIIIRICMICKKILMIYSRSIAEEAMCWKFSKIAPIIVGKFLRHISTNLYRKLLLLRYGLLKIQKQERSFSLTFWSLEEVDACLSYPKNYSQDWIKYSKQLNKKIRQKVQLIFSASKLM